MEGLLLVAALAVAFVNGANDNAKGVATLYGSGILSYRKALALATVSTALGALVSSHFAGGLLRSFSARGLVPDVFLGTEFLAAVGIAAALAVLLATRLGLPVSTTHALLGGITGAGLVVAGSALDVRTLSASFVLPLLLSPVVAIVLAAGVYFGGLRLRMSIGIGDRACVCLDHHAVQVAPAAVQAFAVSAPAPVLTVGDPVQCQRHGDGILTVIRVHTLLDGIHVLSGALVGFARGLNDTPKLLALTGGVSFLTVPIATLAITVAMMLGGLVGARQVAETLGKRITAIDSSRGLASNLATSLLVGVASRFGLPVSTTHVATGGVFGVGATRGGLRGRMVGAILLAWITTLPLAAALAALAMHLLS